MKTVPSSIPMVRRLLLLVALVTFCLSKGLACPVGSIICGTKEFINSARRMRKALGGGMRQAGIIAAAGLSVIDNLDHQIQEDHANAYKLSHGIDNIKGLKIQKATICTRRWKPWCSGGTSGPPR